MNDPVNHLDPSGLNSCPPDDPCPDPPPNPDPPPTGCVSFGTQGCISSSCGSIFGCDGPPSTTGSGAGGGSGSNFGPPRIELLSAPSNAPLSPQAQACENKIQGAVNNALNTNSNYLGPTTGPGLSPVGYRNGAYNFDFFAPGVTNPVAGSNGGSGRFPGSGLHIPLPGGQDPTIMPWGYNAQAGGSYFTAHYDSANPTDDLVSLFEHIINDVILRRPHGC